MCVMVQFECKDNKRAETQRNLRFITTTDYTDETD